MTTNQTTHTEFDFDYWRKLAAEDPQGFEVARRDALMAVISRAGEHRQQRLQGLQWRIDRVRETAANPMAACVKISSMMWDKMLGDGGLLESLRRLEGIEPERLADRPPARVIPLQTTRAADPAE
jgi:hypothetical protein